MISKSDESEDRIDPFVELSYETYHELLGQRIILINGDIKENIIERVTVPLLNMTRRSSKPIEMWINSYGGSMDDAQSVIDVMRTSKAKITTKVLGKAMSASFDIFLAGDKRILLPNSILMCHSGSANLGGRTLPQINVEAQLNLENFNRWADFYASRTKISQNEWLNIIKSGLDRYFFPEESLKMGLAHQVAKHIQK